MVVSLRKVSIIFELTAEQLWNIVEDFFSEPVGRIGDIYLYWVDAEGLAEVLSDPHYQLQEQQRQMLEGLKQVAEAEDGGFYLTFY